MSRPGQLADDLARDHRLAQPDLIRDKESPASPPPEAGDSCVNRRLLKRERLHCRARSINTSRAADQIVWSVSSASRSASPSE